MEFLVLAVDYIKLPRPLTRNCDSQIQTYQNVLFLRSPQEYDSELD